MNKPFAITLDVGSSLANRTGSWRTRRPVYVDRLPPCNHQCPAGENIQQWLYHAEEGEYRKAWEQIMQDNPFPAVMGRVCYHTCESACNRGQLDESVGIHAVERFLGDKAIREGWTIESDAPDTGKRVLVVGAGPSGLSCAYHLQRFGHAVTVMDSRPRAGGMMRYGIPRYRLPRGTLDAEIARIEDLGVQLVLNARVENLDETLREGGFDAAYVALGAQVARMLKVPGQDKGRVLDALQVLASFEERKPIELGARVVVYGGGNTSMDVARSAIRLGAKDVTVVTRGPRERMPAHSFEIKEALEEGVQLRNLRSVTQVDEGALILEVMKEGEGGRVIGTGRFETLPADTLVLAIGQVSDLSLVDAFKEVEVADHVVVGKPDRGTGRAGVYAGGDMVQGERTVTTGIGHGKKAARHIDGYLRGAPYQAPAKHEIAGYERLNTWYYSDAPKTVQPMLELVRRQSGFEEVVGNLDETNALFEARRCLSCGNCFECDNCYGVCPDNAVIKLGPGNRFKFNYEYCKGCGLCVAECPCGAIAVAAEEI